MYWSFNHQSKATKSQILRCRTKKLQQMPTFYFQNEYTQHLEDGTQFILKHLGEWDDYHLNAKYIPSNSCLATTF